MIKTFVVKKVVCNEVISKLKEIQNKIDCICLTEASNYIHESSGESVEEMKKCVDEINKLKSDVYNHMVKATQTITDLVQDHEDLDESSAKQIKQSNQ